MTGKKYNVNLFLRNEEMEDLMKLQDYLWDLDPDNEEDYQRARKWAEIISRLVMGKEGHRPLMITRNKRLK